MTNQITIGRNPQSTIVVDAQYTTVSGSHATITRNDNVLTLEDHSTNGTYINGQKIHHASATIRIGDTITLGHQYPLNMSDVLRYLGGGHETQRIPQPQGTTPAVVNMPASMETPSVGKKTPQCLDHWSWGAFVWGWLWGVCNGVYWPLVTLIPYVGQVAALIICFILGANGNKYAWEKFTGSAEEFDRKQHNWAIAAGIYAIILAVAFIFMLIVLIAES